MNRIVSYILFALGHLSMLLFLPHAVWNWFFVKSEEVQGTGPGPWLPPLEENHD